MIEAPHCLRCNAKCQFTGERNPEARVMRRSAVPEGLCANCAITSFIQGTKLLPMVIEKQGGPDVLLNPAVQAQVAAVLDAGNADAHPSEINWPTVVANWNLPWR
jgi:hypothetical protein